MWNIKVLFAQHAKEINQFLRKRGHQIEVAADLTQEVFVKLLSLKSSEESANPRAYLHAIARNLSIDLYRREQVIETVPMEEGEYCNIVDTSPTPEKIVYDRQRLDIAERALAELPEKTRKAFELYRMEHKTITEVAEELDLSVSRTWTLIQRAYLHLRTELKKDTP